ncbi:MAG: alpha/beta hydrolase [Hyphomicrobiaceae bacterium]
MRNIAAMHPDAERVNAILAELGASGLPPKTVEEMRAFARKRARRLAGEPAPVARVENTVVANGEHRVPVRIYFPEENPTRPLPAYIYAHGGGFVVGDLDMVDAACRTICKDAGIVVISIDYRLAPEHKFPAGLDDTIAATRWVRANASALGVDAGRLAIGGDSAGGNLAAATCQAVAGSGDLDIRLQVLVYPVTDLTCSHPSYQDLGTGYFLTAERMHAYVAHYLNNADEARDPRASPLMAASLEKQPPALVILAGLDPLLDEGQAYARRLREADIEVEIHEVPDHMHGFLGWSRESAAARDALSLIARRLKETLTA